MAKKKASFGSMLFKGALIFNPVLVQIVGICPVVAASTSVAAAALLATVFSTEMVVTCFIASAAMKDIPRYLRVVLYLLFGLAIVCPIMYLLETKVGMTFSVSTTIYLPLIAINSVTALHCEKFSVKNSVRDSFADALAVSIGYSAVFIIVGAIREYLGNGTVAGYALPIAHKLPGMLMPFGSLIILGYLAMALKWYISKAYPQYIESTIMKIQNTSFKLKREEPPEKVEQAVEAEKPVKEAKEQAPEPQATVIPAEQAEGSAEKQAEPQPEPVEEKAEEAPSEQEEESVEEPEDEPQREPEAQVQPPVGVVVPDDVNMRHAAYEEMSKLSKEHDEYINDKDKSLEDLLKSLENDISKIRVSEQDGEEADGDEPVS